MINILIKDVKLILSDKKALAIILLMPVILTSILGVALSGSFADAGSNWVANVALVKEYNLDLETEKAVTDINRILGEYTSDTTSLNIDLNPEKILFKEFLDLDEVKSAIKYQQTSFSEANQLLSDKKVSAIIIIPENYVYDMYINFFTPFRNNIEIKVIGHPDMPYTSRIIEGFFKSFSDIISAGIISKNVLLEEATSLLSANQAMDLISKLDFSSLSNNQVLLENDQIAGKNVISSFMYYAAAMLSMFIFFSAGYAGKYMLHEKEYQTSKRLLSTNVKYSHIVISKFIMTMIIVIIQSTVMILFSKFIFSVNWVSLSQIVITVLLSAVAVAAIGLFIIALTIKHNSYKIYDAFTSFVIQVFALLGGNFIPIDTLPSFIQDLSNYVPNGAILKSYLRILEGTNLSELLPLYFNIFIVSVVFIIIGSLILRKEVKQNA